jgi:site-specific recombinase XerD
LEERGRAPGTINVRMVAVRRLAYEAADSGLLSPELAAGIHRVKGVRKLGSRLGNWLTASEAAALWQVPDRQALTGKRNRAILAILLGCGLRRRELAELTLESLQRREERWAIVDLIGKGRHIRTVPVPIWVKETLGAWLATATPRFLSLATMVMERSVLVRQISRVRSLEALSMTYSRDKESRNSASTDSLP